MVVWRIAGTGASRSDAAWTTRVADPANETRAHPRRRTANAWEGFMSVDSCLAQTVALSKRNFFSLIRRGRPGFAAEAYCVEESFAVPAWSRLRMRTR